MRLAVFGEHVGMLRSLGVTLEQVRMKMCLHFREAFEVILIEISIFVYGLRSRNT